MNMTADISIKLTQEMITLLMKTHSLSDKKEITVPMVLTLIENLKMRRLSIEEDK